ncbi:nitrilase [Epibacterium sp. SM1979]|uniref:Nitrilase n=1 Tax=Tritonibacter litoralis TaxID=2662264 RepID=A0A843YEE5_9RHOB|nr:carbon-nitrogen hydrolase family protein [Tritonibacter litoralis]MQQ08035.1 nitrilase [Tritonibacter litoralis]
MTLAIYQGSPVMGDPEAALTCLERQLSTASAAGASMLVMPELFLPGYNQPALHKSLAQSLNGDWMQRLRHMMLSKNCGVTIGWAERTEAGVFNAATAIDRDGNILGHYHKIQLFGDMEKRSFVPGDRYVIFDLDGIRTALLICYDVEFAQHVHALAAQGVSLILVPTANPTGYEHVPEHLLPARAAEMGISIAYANYCGSEGDLSFCGQSLLVGPDGRYRAKAGASPALLIADLSAEIAPALRSTQLTDLRKVQPYVS